MSGVSEQTLSNGSLAQYSFLALPLAFAGLPFYLYIPDYYTREMGLGLASAGVILIVLRVLDAIQDPLIGYLSDRNTQIRSWMIVVGFIGLALGMGALMFGPPSFIPVEQWFGAMIALTALGLSATGINFVMLGSLWQADEALRQKISAFREGFGLLGMLLASTLPPLLMISFAKPEAFKVYYCVFAALLAVGAYGFYRFYRNLPPRDSQKHAKRIRIPGTFITHNFGFFLACFLTHIAASLPAALFLYFVQDYLGAGNGAGLFLFLYFLSGAALMPAWLHVGRRTSAESAWAASAVLAVITFIWAYTLAPEAYFQFGVICILSGAALGADLALPPAILGRRIMQQAAENFAAQAYAILNVIPKIALALATGVAFVVLDRTGFSPSDQNDQDALAMLAALYALVPCLFKAASACVIFNLVKGDKHELQERSADHGRTYGA